MRIYVVGVFVFVKKMDERCVLKFGFGFFLKVYIEVFLMLGW